MKGIIHVNNVKIEGLTLVQRITSGEEGFVPSSFLLIS